MKSTHSYQFSKLVAPAAVDGLEMQVIKEAEVMPNAASFVSMHDIMKEKPVFFAYLYFVFLYLCKLLLGQQTAG